MAEERLIDDNTDKDKNRKYRIVLGEDGSEELEYNEEYDEEYEEYEDDFSDEEEDGEDAEEDEEHGGARSLAAKQQSEAKLQSARQLFEKAQRLYAAGENEYALATLDSAAKECSAFTPIYPLMAEILTQGFTDISAAEDCADCIEKCRKYCTAEERAQLKQKLAPIVKAERDNQFTRNEELGRENEQAKAERRKPLEVKFRAARRNFLFAAVPFLVFFIAGLALSSVMYADKSGVYYVLTIVFLCLSGAALVAGVVLGKLLADAWRACTFNERNSSSALGRSYAQGLKRAELLDRLYYDLTEGVN